MKMLIYEIYLIDFHSKASFHEKYYKPPTFPELLLLWLLCGG